MVPQELINLLEGKRGCDIIGMDANAHSHMWGSNDNNTRGDMIEEFLFCYNLTICNKGSQPTFVARGSKTIIDITVCSSNMVGSINRWKVDTRDQLSDHRRITFRVGLETQSPSKGWATKKADGVKFSKVMGNKSDNFRPHGFWTVNTLEREVRFFYEDLRASISKVCPRIKVRQHQTNHWWSSELSSMRRKVRQLQQQVMKDRENFSLWVQYKRERNNFCSSIRKAKRLAWKSFTEDATSPEAMMKVAKAVLQQRAPQVGHLRKPDGSYTQTKGEVLDTLLDAFFPDSKDFREADVPPIDFVLRCDISKIITSRKLEQGPGTGWG